MKLSIEPGKYIVAVSGGVDSMVLLDLLTKQKGLSLVVAHFDHGIRPDSSEDAELVKRNAKRLGLVFELGEGELGTNASEDAARSARYEFLNGLKEKHLARAIITAHHQDDLIETAIINILRGTGPRGVFSILDNPNVLRPLLAIPKTEIIKYAQKNNIEWREDDTNSDEKYLRNYVRARVVGKMSQTDRIKLVNHISDIYQSHKIVEDMVAQLSSTLLISDRSISREQFIALPMEVAAQFLHSWLIGLGVKDIDRATIDRISVAIKTASANSKANIKQGYWLKFSLTMAQFTNTLTTA